MKKTKNEFLKANSVCVYWYKISRKYKELAIYVCFAIILK